MFWSRRKKFVGSYALELDQALVVAGAVRLTHAVGSLIAEKVQVHALPGVRLHRVEEVPRPGDVAFRLRIFLGPDRVDVHVAGRAALAEAVSPSATRPRAPPSWKTMQYDFGEVMPSECSTSVPTGASVSVGSSTDFQKRYQPCGTKGSNIDCKAA